MGANKPAYGSTDVGQQRDYNEDYYRLLPETGIYIVADGMGGHNAGDVASVNAVNSVAEYLTSQHILERRNHAERIMIQAVTEAHEKLVEMSGTNTEYAGMGSTIAVSFIHDNVLNTCHVGDSRVYIINFSGITQVTNDHSTVAELVRLGKMTSGEARYSPRKNEITQALGAPISIDPEYNQHSLKRDDVVLICSDGLWNMVWDEDIWSIVIRRKNLKDACKELIQQANAAGGDDNITVILVQIGEA
jgi:protein phosphatase